MLEVTYITLKVALAATVINFPFALYIGWILGRRNPRGRLILEVLISLPLALPPVVTGYALLLALGSRSPIGSFTQFVFGSDIIFTWVAASLAAAVVSFPLMVRSIIVAMSAVDPRLERSARSLGAGPMKTFFSITLPLSYQGVIAGTLLGFVRALSEFGATIIVAGNIPGVTQTLPLAIFAKVQTGRTSEAFELVAVSVILAVISLAIHNWLLSRSSNRGVI